MAREFTSPQQPAAADMVIGILHYIGTELALRRLGAVSAKECCAGCGCLCFADEPCPSCLIARAQQVRRAS